MNMPDQDDFMCRQRVGRLIALATGGPAPDHDRRPDL